MVLVHTRLPSMGVWLSGVEVRDLRHNIYSITTLMAWYIPSASLDQFLWSGFVSVPGFLHTSSHLDPTSRYGPCDLQ